MEELTDSDSGELSIGGFKPRESIPEGTYEAEYVSHKAEVRDTKWGKKKQVQFRCKIVSGPHQGTTTSGRFNMAWADSIGQWVIGDRSKLAGVIKAITGGESTLNETHKGNRVFVCVKTFKGRDGDMIDFIGDMLRHTSTAPGTVALADKSEAPKPVAAKEEQKVAEPVGKKDSLASELDDLGDYDV